MISEKYIHSILGLPRPTKRALALLVDSNLCILTIWLSYCFRLNDWVTLSGIQFLPIPISLCLALPIFVVMGLYRAIFRFIGLAAFWTVTKAVVIYGLAFAIIFTVIGVPGIPRTIGILQPLLLLLAIGISRFLPRYFLHDAYNRALRKRVQSNVLVYGAGRKGRQFTSGINHDADFKVVGYLDDDPGLVGSVIEGVKVYSPVDIGGLTSRLKVKAVLLALPHIDRARRNAILDGLREAKVAVRSVPDLSAIAGGKSHISDFQELEIEDLLGRMPVDPNQMLLERNAFGKVVLVTGAAGSIGSELCRQLVKLKPACLLLLDQNEYGLYALQNELQVSEVGHDVPLVPLLASVCDDLRVRKILDTWRPHTVYHAAAYKHVPLVEQNPVEGVKTNVIGTRTIAQAAIDSLVATFILVSTDKAVRPTNIMGATKRLAEMVLQSLAEAQSSTTFSMVRFGNVLGSSGSVVPLFRQQIQKGGPVTLTHPEITRFFMTGTEASQLVIQAGAMAKGGDVYVLDMGEPVKIYNLARRMIELSGQTVRDSNHPDGDIAIVMSGLRPGEKLYEELLIGDNPEPTEHPMIMRAREGFLSLAALVPQLQELEMAAIDGDVNRLRAKLSELVGDYSAFAEIVDLVSVRNRLGE